jgi:hypothetical protein
LPDSEDENGRTQALAIVDGGGRVGHGGYIHSCCAVCRTSCPVSSMSLILAPDSTRPSGLGGISIVGKMREKRGKVEVSSDTALKSKPARKDGPDLNMIVIMASLGERLLSN